MIPIDMIKVYPGFNLRVTDSVEYQEGVEELADSILTEGYYSTKPLSGFASLDAEGEDVVYVTDGHRRLDAAKRAVAKGAELERLPVIFKPVDTTSLDLAVALHKENAAVPLTMMERAVLVRRLLTSGLTETEVASRLHVTERYVSDLKLLVAAPRQVRALVTGGKITGTEAVQQLRKNVADPAAVAEKLQALADKADKKGVRLTKTTIKGNVEAPPKTKMFITRLSLNLAKGSTAALEDVQPFMSLFTDSDWYMLTERPNEVKAVEDVTVEVVIRRPREAEVPEETAQADEPAVRKSRRKAAAPVETVEDDDPLGVNGEADDEEGAFQDAPDLHQEGVADRATGL